MSAPSLDEEIVTPYKNNEDQRQVTTSKRSSTALTLKDDLHGASGLDTSAKLGEPSISKTREDTNTLVIDWEGPDDPENPKKRVIVYCISRYLSSHGDHAAGLCVGSGWRRS